MVKDGERVASLKKMKTDIGLDTIGSAIVETVDKLDALIVILEANRENFETRLTEIERVLGIIPTSTTKKVKL